MCIEITLNIINTIASIATLIFAVYVLNQFSFKKDLKKKQLETVFSLIQSLQNLQITIQANIDAKDENGFYGFSGTLRFPFFEMTLDKYNELSDSLKNEKSGNLRVAKGFLYLNPIMQFVKNPFLPKEIAMELIKLYPRGGIANPYFPSKNLIYIGDYIDYGDNNYVAEISNHYKTLHEFFKATDSLNNELQKWLKDKGLNNLNLLNKHINMTNFP